MSEINTAYPHVPFLPRDHTENRRKIPPEHLDLFRGQYVAYSWEGDRIVAGAASEEELCQRLIDSGIDPQRVVFSCVED